MNCHAKPFTLALLASVALTQVGCITMPHMVYEPQAVAVPAEMLKPIPAKSPISVVSVPISAEERLLFGYTYYTLPAVSAEATRVLKAALGGMRLTVSQDAKKTIKVSIDDLKLDQGLVKSSVTALLHVQTESGYERIFEGIENSGMSGIRAANAAIGRAVANLLKDPEFINYLSE